MSELAPVAALVGAVAVFLVIDLTLFARGREPSFKEGVAWSLGWLAVGLLAALVVWALEGEDKAVVYTTVYLVERSLSLDNLFLFLLLFAYFAVPVEQRARLVFWGIVVALALRGLAIVGGVALIERFHFVVYVLGATLLVLAYRIFRADDRLEAPADNLVLRGVRKALPVTEGYHGKRWFTRREGALYTTPLFLCLVAMVVADIAFAIDSIPVAFGITRDPLLIWMGNVFALLGLRALFVVVDGLLRRFRYLDETIAIILAVVGIKLLIEGVYEPPPEASLAVVLILLSGGIVASRWADRREAAREAPDRGG